MAGADFIIEKAVYVNQLARMLEQGGRLYHSISANGEPLLANSQSIIENISKENYLHIIIKHPSFADDIPNVSLVGGNGVNWYIFDTLRGDGHILLTAKKFSNLASGFYYITLGYGSFFIDHNGNTIGPREDLVKVYRNISSRFRGYCTKKSLSDLKSSMVSRRMIEEIPNWLEICREELGLNSPVSLRD